MPTTALTQESSSLSCWPHWTPCSSWPCLTSMSCLKLTSSRRWENLVCDVLLLFCCTFRLSCSQAIRILCDFAVRDCVSAGGGNWIKCSLVYFLMCVLLIPWNRFVWKCPQKMSLCLTDSVLSYCVAGTFASQCVLCHMLPIGVI